MLLTRSSENGQITFYEKKKWTNNLSIILETGGVTDM